MSKCKPDPKTTLLSLRDVGVVVQDVRTITSKEESREVVIRIPYEQLRDNEDVQIAFQNLIGISTED